MPKIAIVEKITSRINYGKHFDFEFDTFALTSSQNKKILRADIDLDMSLLDTYDFVILIGAEPAKFIAKVGSVAKYSGQLVDNKYIVLFSPAMLVFRPELKPNFEASVKLLHKHLAGTVKVSAVSYLAIETSAEALAAVKDLAQYATIAVDTETSSLYPKNGIILGIGLSGRENTGVYINTNCITQEIEGALQELFNTSKIVFHNAKFDMKFLFFHFNFVFPDWEDTMLMHYLLDENSPHDLKYLALKYTDMGEYDKTLDEFKRGYCRENRVLQRDFTYAAIPWDIISEYGAADPDCTLRLYNKFSPIIERSGKTIKKVYDNILKPGTGFLLEMEMSGVPFSKSKLLALREELENDIFALESVLYKKSAVCKAEKQLGGRINFNSTKQLQVLLYDVLHLPILGRTPGGAISTNAAVLEELADIDPIAADILALRKMAKIKSTYVDKVLYGIDLDGNLRTGFHLHTVTSGRLSSSGKLNMQQLPRDDKRVKDCIVAPEGYVIVSQDLKTAEMYYAAVLSGDKNLQKIFTQKGDFHSNIARMVFNVPEAEELEGRLRQAAKAISFGILYGSGAKKVSEGANCSVKEAKGYIERYFGQFSKLKHWLDLNKDKIQNRGFAYSFFGRKRRVPEVASKDSGISSGGVRSCINFLIQSVASDVNLLAAIDMHSWLKTSKVSAYIFALVHDSILAVVKESDLKEYNEKLAYFTQLDRGCGISGSPIGLDVEIGETYAFKS